MEESIETRPSEAFGDKTMAVFDEINVNARSANQQAQSRTILIDDDDGIQDNGNTKLEEANNYEAKPQRKIYLDILQTESNTFRERSRSAENRKRQKSNENGASAHSSKTAVERTSLDHQHGSKNFPHFST